MRHPVLFRSVAEHLVGGRGVGSFAPQELSNLAWAYARQAQLGAEKMDGYEAGTLSKYKVAFVDIGEHLLQKLFFAIAEVSLSRHGKRNDPSAANFTPCFNSALSHTILLTMVITT